MRQGRKAVSLWTRILFCRGVTKTVWLPKAIEEPPADYVVETQRWLICVDVKATALVASDFYVWLETFGIARFKKAVGLPLLFSSFSWTCKRWQYFCQRLHSWFHVPKITNDITYIANENK